MSRGSQSAPQNFHAERLAVRKFGRIRDQGKGLTLVIFALAGKNPHPCGQCVGFLKKFPKMRVSWYSREGELLGSSFVKELVKVKGRICRASHHHH